MNKSIYIERFTCFERLVHWAQAIAFLLCAVSGLGMFSQTYHEALTGLFGGAAVSMWVHKIAGLVFGCCAILHFLMEWKENLTFDQEDAKWVGQMGGYLTRKNVHFNLGKYNTGQKLFGIVIFAGAVVMLITGWIMWYPLGYSMAAKELAYALHALFFVVMTLFFFIHLYLSTIGNPGCAEGMFYGTVLKKWAMLHSPRWVKEKIN
ncbi:MAG: formate dehydrogenase subunit gamma [Desulfobulbaceae bacterium A2]|nr:MAG: formate dehydrogenase subunit gamma [Desulfobulbaceae bacterium A2]